MPNHDQSTADRSGKRVYLFGASRTDGTADMKELLGGKGANLAEMASLGLPVPPGFTITTEVCNDYYRNGNRLPEGLKAEVEAALGEVGRSVGGRFGDVASPLLVSVRSGARASMPGMMDTILNLGLTDKTVQALAEKSGNPRFAYDSYRRVIQMYADVVLGVDHGVFEDILSNYKNLNGATLDTELSDGDWREIIAAYMEAVEQETGKPFPQDTQEQLWGAIGAVFSSWHNDRAKTYRHLHGIPDSWGTAVNVHAMVFGNLGESSATGVAFTRNPSTGTREIYGEFLVNAQGEDVVAGIRTPQPLTEAARKEAGEEAPSLEALMPETFMELKQAFANLERRYRDMQDIEFTIQDGKLWLLQTRSGKRTTKAALRIATDMVAEGVISEEDAILRIEPAGLDQLLHPSIDPEAEKTVVARGLPASPGAAAGEIVFDADEAETLKGRGREVILVRVETSPEDIHGMHAAAGILTTRGGMTSHAAVVARGMGRPCVCGAGALRIDYAAGTMTVGHATFRAGDVITIDGGTGEVLKGRVKMRQPELSGDFATVMGWADKARRLGVRVNADTPREARQAREFGAEGIGLCRTEHMFFDESRILAMREMICADDEAGRRKALAKMLPMQRSDFEELFEIMAGLPVTIRLLDPPLHEFLPREAKEAAAVAKELGVPLEKLRGRVSELHEFNPMLGFRGCRLAIRYPEITEMQARAIFEAAAKLNKEGLKVVPEVMIPLVGDVRELRDQKAIVERVAAEVIKEQGIKIKYLVGTMIEVPRGALTADEVAKEAQFFSFGTNDLTQMTFGFSRDDVGKFLRVYQDRKILEKDPFATFDGAGTGQLVDMAVKKGRATRKDIKLGICGEHGGDPSSIHFFDKVGLDYVSCSPYRVPVARLAAAQAALSVKVGD